MKNIRTSVEELVEKYTHNYLHSNVCVGKSSKLHNQQALIACGFIDAYELLCVEYCQLTNMQTRTSIQVSRTQHVEAETAVRFTNHSCQPNAAIYSKIIDAHTAFVALYSVQPIVRQSEITFDYATTEFDITPELQQLSCKCGSQACRGKVLGYNSLSDEQKHSLRKQLLVSDYILNYT